MPSAEGSEQQELVGAVIERLTAARMVVDWRGHEHALFPVAITPAEGQALRGWIERERGGLRC